MPSPAASLVVTTVFDPVVLEAYHSNFSRYGHLDEVEVIVVPDRKTPESAFTRCRSLGEKGMKTRCPSIDEQEDFLRGVGFPPHLIPYNSDNRRNVGYLMALASGSDFVISIDDDNYCTEGEDVFAEHSVVCQDSGEYNEVESATGFFNVCDLLELERPAPLYPRGFPYSARHGDEQPKITRRSASIHINAGLWLLDPDVDGITWLVAMPRVRSFKGTSVILGRDTWSPVNSQNTALRRSAIPSYYFVKMGYSVTGLPIDRYGDIFSGYFAQACARHLGGCVRAGTPVAEHRRNSHNYLRDATNEWSCILLLEDLLPWLREAKLSGGSCAEAYLSLSHAIEEAVEQFKGTIWTDVARGYFHQMAFHMRAWLRACGSILG